MGILRRRAAALAVGATLVGSAGATRTAPTTTLDRHSSGGTTATATSAATKRIRSETAAMASSSNTPSSMSGLRGSFADGHGEGPDDELDGSARGDLASKLIAELGEEGHGARAGGGLGDEEFAATLAEAFGSRGREGELAEKLLAGLGEGGARQQLLAAKLLAGLDAEMQRDGDGGGGGGEDELAMETSSALSSDLVGREAAPAEDKEEEGKLSAAVAEALDRIREGGGEGGGVLEHILTGLMKYTGEDEDEDKDKDEEKELPLRGLVREPAWRGGGVDALLDSGDARVATGGFVDDLPTATAAPRGHEDVAAAAAAAAGSSGDPVVESLPSQLAGAIRRTFGGLLQPFQAADDAAALAGDKHGDGLVFGEAERAERSAQGRRLQTSASDVSDVSDGSDGGGGGNEQIEIVTMNGPTSTDWNGAYYTLEVGDTLPAQTLPTGKIIARGTILEGQEPSQQTENLERGCYIIYTSAGTRPYDVLWELQVGGELYHNVAGGGQDSHTFGVLGALCDISDCYRQCFLAHDDGETNFCANYGDLLAPPDEPAGANCTCAEDEELELRLQCLQRGCDSRGQCYLDDAEIRTAPTLTILSYVQTVTNTIDVVGMENAVAQWLDLDPSYVDLVRVNGHKTSTSALPSRRRLGVVWSPEAEEEEEEEEGVFGHPNGGGGEGGWPGMGEERAEWERQARNRGLQTAIFKRLEFRIIGTSVNDFPFISTLAEGVRGLETVLRAQDEASGVQQVTPLTAEYTGVEDTRVAVVDIPEVAIAGSGGGTGVDEEGEVIVQATDAPAEFGDFTTSTQFLIGAGLVVVVSFFLSIVACIVCRMKRRARKEFIRNNAPEDGRRKPVAYVDPWGSVARTFQGDSKAPNANGGSSVVSGSSSRLGGQHANGSGSAQGRSGSRTANSSASA